MDVNADFETETRVEESLKGCRIVNAIMYEGDES